jgi:uncharacterized protein YcbK (DUF882 family)
MKVLECFKRQTHASHILQLHPFVVMVAMDMLLYVSANGYTPIITSIIRTPHESKQLGAVSSTHETGRAFDLRIKDWSKDFISEFVAYFSHKYKGHGAYNTSGEERFIVIHGEGDNIHAHIQFNKDYGCPTAWLKI